MYLGVKIWINVLATMFAIAFIWIIGVFDRYTNLLLSTEVILLPSVYIVGNILVESHIEARYDASLDRVNERLEELNKKYYKAQSQIIELKHENALLREELR